MLASEWVKVVLHDSTMNSITPFKSIQNLLGVSYLCSCTREAGVGGALGFRSLASASGGESERFCSLSNARY